MTALPCSGSHIGRASIPARRNVMHIDALRQDERLGASAPHFSLTLPSPFRYTLLTEKEKEIPYVNLWSR